MDNYFTKSQINLNRNDVEAIMSTSNVKTAMVSAVNSMPFFQRNKGYHDMIGFIGENEPELFKFEEEHSDFASISGLVDGNGCA